MASLFTEFTNKYNEFKKRYPNHPLVEELRGKIYSGNFPHEQWLRARIQKMDRFLIPFWAQCPPEEAGEQAEKGKEPDNVEDGAAARADKQQRRKPNNPDSAA